MKFSKLDKKYVSEGDQFLVNFDQKTPTLSRSQQKEIQKAARIARLMKTPDQPAEPKAEIWKEF
ncbi:MAG: CBU_0585 family protein [Gammaproteobacteria bacterium]